MAIQVAAIRAAMDPRTARILESNQNVSERKTAAADSERASTVKVATKAAISAAAAPEKKESVKTAKQAKPKKAPTQKDYLQRIDRSSKGTNKLLREVSSLVKQGVQLVKDNIGTIANIAVLLNELINKVGSTQQPGVSGPPPVVSAPGGQPAPAPSPGVPQQPAPVTPAHSGAKCPLPGAVGSSQPIGTGAVVQLPGVGSSTNGVSGGLPGTMAVPGDLTARVQDFVSQFVNVCLKFLQGLFPGGVRA